MTTAALSPRIGIIGGYGPGTSAAFCARLVEHAQKLRQDRAPSFAMDSIPISMEDARRCIAGEEEATRQLIRDANGGIRRLAAAGVTTIAVPCNSLHALFSEFEQPKGVTLLHIADVLMRALATRRCRRVGLLASSLTIGSGMYTGRFAQAGIACVLPSAARQTAMNAAIASYVKTGGVDADARSLLASVLKAMEQSGVDAVALGCTDIAGMLKLAQAPSAVPCIDSMDVLAEECARRSVAF